MNATADDMSRAHFEVLDPYLLALWEARKGSKGGIGMPFYHLRGVHGRTRPCAAVGREAAVGGRHIRNDESNVDVEAHDDMDRCKLVLIGKLGARSLFLEDREGIADQQDNHTPYQDAIQGPAAGLPQERTARKLCTAHIILGAG